MTELKSLEKLRNAMGGYGSSDNYFVTLKDKQFDELCDAIQAEVDEYYMPLPLDAEGVPIRVGDCIAEKPYRPNLGEKPSEIVCMLFNSDGWCVSDRDPFGHWASPITLVHVKPRTVEDVLRDCCNEWNEHCGDDWESGVYAKYADELRWMMEVRDD